MGYPNYPYLSEMMRKNYPSICGFIFPVYEKNEIFTFSDKLKISIIFLINITLFFFFFTPLLFISLYYSSSNLKVFYQRNGIGNRALTIRRMNTVLVIFILSALFRINGLIISYLVTGKIPDFFWH